MRGASTKNYFETLFLSLSMNHIKIPIQSCLKTFRARNLFCAIYQLRRLETFYNCQYRQAFP